jgi:hypothetical protein
MDVGETLTDEPSILSRASDFGLVLLILTAALPNCLNELLRIPFESPLKDFDKSWRTVRHFHYPSVVDSVYVN